MMSGRIIEERNKKALNQKQAVGETKRMDNVFLLI
jgi:hypothetical protein